MFRARLLLVPLAVAAAALMSGCASQGPMGPQTTAPTMAPEMPPKIRAEEITGRWGLAAFHKPEDRARTETMARNGCKQPYVITMGPTGGVMMHLADSAKAEELRMKGAPGDKTFIGPPGETPGMQDREIVSFDGRVMVTRFVDPEVNSRYGTQVFVRCAPRA